MASSLLSRFDNWRVPRRKSAGRPDSCNRLPSVTPGQAIERLSDQRQGERRQDTIPALSVCPICQGKLEMVYDRNNQQVLICEDCHVGVTVPGTAWEIARVKRNPMPKQ